MTERQLGPSDNLELLRSPGCAPLHELLYNYHVFNMVLNHNIYITADPTPVDVDNAAHACHCIEQGCMVGRSSPWPIVISNNVILKII